MPVRARRTRTQRKRAVSEDLYRNFYINIPSIKGVNQTLAPNLIPDDECQEIWNYLPTAKGTIKKIKSAKVLVETGSKQPIKIIIHPLNGTYQGLIFYDNGSVDKWDGSSLTEVASSGTLSGDIESIDFCVWQNDRIYVIDSTGYYKWDGSSFTNVSTSIKGHCITVWQGRVFVGNGSQVSYSVALDPEDFAGTGSGYFDLAESFPDLKLKVKKIVPYIDSLAIYGDSAIMALTGSTISNDPSTWYLTEASNTIGIEKANTVVNYGNEVWLQNEKGLYRTTMSSQQKFDYKVNVQTNVQILNYQATIVPINNLLHYLIPARINSPFRGNSDNILAFCIDTAEFFFLDIGQDIKGIYWSYVEGTENRIYVLLENAIGALFEGKDSISSYIKTKQFDLGKASLEKLWWFLMFPVNIREGLMSLNVRVITEKTVKEASVDKYSLGTRHMFQWYNKNNEKITFSNENLVWGMYAQFIGTTKAIFRLGAVGIWGTFEIIENSNAVFEIANLHIRTQLGRDVF